MRSRSLLLVCALSALAASAACATTYDAATDYHASSATGLGGAQHGTSWSEADAAPPVQKRPMTRAELDAAATGAGSSDVCVKRAAEYHLTDPALAWRLMQACMRVPAFDDVAPLLAEPWSSMLRTSPMVYPQVIEIIVRGDPDKLDLAVRSLHIPLVAWAAQESPDGDPRDAKKQVPTTTSEAYPLLTLRGRVMRVTYSDGARFGVVEQTVGIAPPPPTKKKRPKADTGVASRKTGRKVLLRLPDDAVIETGQEYAFVMRTAMRGTGRKLDAVESADDITDFVSASAVRERPRL